MSLCHPGERPNECVERLGARQFVGEIADEAHQLGKSLAAAGGIDAHGTLDAACTSLPHPPESVDQEVVSDVRETSLWTHMEVVCAAQDRHHALGLVVVGARGVVDEQTSDVLWGQVLHRITVLARPRRSGQDREARRHLHAIRRSCWRASTPLRLWSRPNRNHRRSGRQAAKCLTPSQGADA